MGHHITNHQSPIISPITDHQLPNMHSTSHHTIPLITHQTTSTFSKQTVTDANFQLLLLFEAIH